MLVVSPMQPQPIMHDAVRCMPYDDDDDDALQAVLLASLCQGESQQQAQSAGESVSHEQEVLLSKCTAPPRISTPISLTTYAVEAGLDSEAQRALQAFEDGPCHLKLSRVRGDGHCLFRAIAASLTLTAAWGGANALAAMQHHLESLVESCSKPVVSAVFSLLGRNATENASVIESLNEETKSDAAVAALRQCATAYMRHNIERFRLCCDNEDFDSYCSRMEAMTGDSPDFVPAYGGHSEIVALSEALRVRVEIVDCSGNGEKSLVPMYRLGEHLPSSSPTVHLLRRGPHYHLMLPAQAEGDRMLSDSPEL